MDPLFWLFIWVVGMAVIGGANGGAVGALYGCFIGFVLWLIIGFVLWLWGALSVNDCVEYGYSMSKTCSDEEIQQHVEEHSPW